MKKHRYIILLLCIVFAFNGMAQTAKSAYFLDGTYHNFKLNPAMDAERGFLSFGLGNLTIGANSNVGLSDFIYPQGDKLNTFMSGSVDPNVFLNKLPQSIRFGLNFDETLMALGFRMFGGYTSFSLSMHSSTSIALPKSFFEFAKKGLQGNSYDFSGINFNTMNYAAATLGYSHEVYEGLRVGINLKFLTGLAYANATFDKFTLELSEERFKAEAHALAQAATFAETYYNDQNLQIASFSPSAKGFAVDFGAVYDMKEFVPGLTLSASLLDLGKINWQYMMALENDGTPVEWNGLTDADINNIGDAMAEEFEKLGEGVANMLKFKVYDTQKVATKLGATMYLGAEYNMPFYNPLSVAMLYGKKFSTYTGWNEFRSFINIAPLKWVEASANIGFTTFGTSWGWMFNFHPGWTSFFIGSDYMISKVTPQFIPVNDLNYHLTIGFNMPLGKRKSDLKRKSDAKRKESRAVDYTVLQNAIEVIEEVQEEAPVEVQEEPQVEAEVEAQEEAQEEILEDSQEETQVEIVEETQVEVQSEVQENAQVEIQEDVQEEVQEEVLNESEVTSTTEDDTIESSLQ